VSDRDRLIHVVQRLMDGHYSGEEEVDSLVAEFQHGVLDPAATDLIFRSSSHFDHEPAAAEVVDRALRYRPIEL
jgi:Colicin immunity protein / pyocin immunity protein